MRSSPRATAERNSMPAYDPRITPARGDLAAKALEGKVAAARYIGNSYLSEPRHRQRAMQTLDEFQRLGLNGPAEIAAHLQARRQRDFSRGAIFVQDGWVFADIEARICAILALA